MGCQAPKKLAQGIVETLLKTNGSCIIMKNHGALCYGRDFEETFDAANQMEAACNEYAEKMYMEKSQKTEFDESEFCSYVLSLYGAGKKQTLGMELDIKLSDTLILNDSKVAIALSYIKNPLRPMVDDFAQIAGIKMEKVKNKKKHSIKSAFYIVERIRIIADKINVEMI